MGLRAAVFCDKLARDWVDFSQGFASPLLKRKIEPQMDTTERSEMAEHFNSNIESNERGSWMISAHFFAFC
jgi:hypothetical protein